MVVEQTHPPADKALIAKAQAGQVDAYGQLYERYVSVVFRYIRARVADTRDAEDLTEQVFLRAYEALDRYKERGRSYSAFLYQVARNAIIDHYRKHREEETIEAAERIVDQKSIAPDDSVILKEQFQEISQAIAQLSPDYQEVIRLRIVMALPTSMVAEWLGRKEGAVRVLLYRALKDLRKRLRESDEWDER